MRCDEVESFRHFFLYYSRLSVVHSVRDFSTEWHFHEFNVNVMDQRVLAHANATACRHTKTATTITLHRLPVECDPWVLQVLLCSTKVYVLAPEYSVTVDSHVISNLLTR